MPPYTKPRRDRYLVQGDLINALGGYKTIAAACLVTTDNVNKWKQNPEGNGQDIPVKHLQTLLKLAGDNLSNIVVQHLADELMQDHFLNLLHRRMIPDDKAYEIVSMLMGENGGKP